MKTGDLDLLFKVTELCLDNFQEQCIWADGVKGRILEGVPDTEQSRGRIRVNTENQLMNYEK